jgi:hypothetical protein
LKEQEERKNSRRGDKAERFGGKRFYSNSLEFVLDPLRQSFRTGPVRPRGSDGFSTHVIQNPGRLATVKSDGPQGFHKYAAHRAAMLQKGQCGNPSWALRYQLFVNVSAQ